MMIQVFICLFCALSLFGNSNIPPDFLWGAVTSEYQVSGSEECKDSTWAAFETKEKAITTGELSQDACRHFKSGESYIGALKALHCNAYRFSIEWSKYEPQEGEYDESVLEHYSKFVDELLKAGITPVVTLHHFSEPQWFLEKGGFAEEENNVHFIEFALNVMKKLMGRVSIFVTFNEATTYAVCGYYPHVGCPPYPPCEDDKGKCKAVLNHMMQAHCSIYANAKRMFSSFPSLKIGFVHQFFKLDIMDRDDLGVIEARYYEGIEKHYHGPFYYALKDGVVLVKGKRIPLKKIVDFIGINYFSVSLLNKNKISINEEAGDYFADNNFRCCKGELYRVLMDLKYLNLPIYITAAGVPDQEDKYRARWIQDHIGEVKRALSDGVAVRGFFYSSLVDNFEWTEGYSMKFGLYGYDRINHTMQLKEGAKEYTRQIMESSTRP